MTISSLSPVPTLLESRVLKRICKHRRQRECIAESLGWSLRTKFSWRTCIFAFVVSGLSTGQRYSYRDHLSSMLTTSEYPLCVYNVFYCEVLHIICDFITSNFLAISCFSFSCCDTNVSLYHLQYWHSGGFETRAAFIWQTLRDTGYCTRHSTALQLRKIKHAKATLKLWIVKYLKSDIKKCICIIPKIMIIMEIKLL